jgi:hypothetical protein
MRKALALFLWQPCLVMIFDHLDPKIGETRCKIKNIGVGIIQIGHSKHRRSAIKHLLSMQPRPVFRDLQNI